LEWRAMLQVAGITACSAIGFYLIFVYVVVYLRQIVHVSAAEALDINSLNMAAMVVLVPLIATLSDRIGRKKVLMAAAVGIVVLTWPLFALIHSGVGALIWLGQFGFAVLVAAYRSVMPAVMAEAFPASLRCSAVSVAYNVPTALFGGTAPMVAAFLINREHDDFSPAYFLIAAGVISVIAIATMRETAAGPLRA
ncbi:MAG: MFS transporter, partial [Ferrovibrionaceae bacterium]